MARLTEYQKDVLRIGLRKGVYPHGMNDPRDHVLTLASYGLMAPEPPAMRDYRTTQEGSAALESGTYDRPQTKRKPTFKGESQTTDVEYVKIAASDGVKVKKASDTFGLYSVHLTYDEGMSQSNDKDKWTVTHRPSGLSIAKFPTQAKANDFASYMHRTAGDAGSAWKFGKSPDRNDADAQTVASAIRGFKP